jgi:hypothetical protein
MDAWIGGLAEDRVPGALVGELVREVLAHQFEILRDGDRFWYQVRYGGVVRDWLEAQRLSDVIKRNTEIGDELPGDVFHVGGI